MCDGVAQGKSVFEIPNEIIRFTTFDIIVSDSSYGVIYIYIYIYKYIYIYIR